MDVRAWELIFDKAGDLLETILKEQPKSEIDAVDVEVKINEVLKKIAYAELNPRDDWSVVIKNENKAENLDQKIKAHFDIAFRQGVYVRLLYEFHIKRVVMEFSEASQVSQINKLGEEMIDAFACAQQHATACILLKEVKEKNFSARAEKGKVARKEKQEEEKVLLRGLIRGALSKRPANGWPGYVRTAQLIAKSLSGLIDEYGLSISSDVDQLTEKVSKLIVSENSLRRAYNDNAKQHLPEPVKLRKSRIDIFPT